MAAISGQAYKCLIVSKLYPGKCVHLEGGNTGNGTKIHLWDIQDKDFPAQEWLVQGGNTIIKSVKAPRMSLQLDHGKTGNGTNVHLWELRGSTQ